MKDLEDSSKTNQKRLLLAAQEEKGQGDFWRDCSISLYWTI